jgi:DNA-binding XRE family transcriptional regulator
MRKTTNQPHATYTGVRSKAGKPTVWSLRTTPETRQLTEARMKLGFTQQQMADKLKVKLNRYNGWETGRTKADPLYLQKAVQMSVRRKSVATKPTTTVVTPVASTSSPYLPSANYNNGTQQTISIVAPTSSGSAVSSQMDLKTANSRLKELSILIPHYRNQLDCMDYKSPDAVDAAYQLAASYSEYRRL